MLTMQSRRSDTKRLMRRGSSIVSMDSNSQFEREDSSNNPMQLLLKI